MKTIYQNPYNIVVHSLCSSFFAMTLLPVQAADLGSKTENSVGISYSKYTYDEFTYEVPNFMSLKAKNVGIDYSGTYALGSQWPNQGSAWFIRGDLRYATGAADYESPKDGSISDTPNRYVEGRLMLGKDFDMGSYVLAPYAGIGLRYLHNDLRRHPAGYRRDTSYTSLPIGVIHRTKLSDQSVLSTTFEYAHLLSGVSKAQLSDINSSRENLSLKQHKGHGLRLSMMLRMDNWSFGPTFSYWKIAKSEVYKGWFEPENTTREFGIKAFYHF